MKSIQDVVAKLNERYLNDECFENGISFVYWDSCSVQSIALCDSLTLWLSDCEDMSDEDGKFDYLKLYQHCQDEFEMLIKMLASKF